MVFDADFSQNKTDEKKNNSLIHFYDKKSVFYMKTYAHMHPHRARSFIFNRRPHIREMKRSTQWKLFMQVTSWTSIINVLTSSMNKTFVTQLPRMCVCGEQTKRYFSSLFTWRVASFISQDRYSEKRESQGFIGGCFEGSEISPFGVCDSYESLRPHNPAGLSFRLAVALKS